MTQLYQAGKGQPTDEIRKVAEYEGIDVQKLTRRVAKGYVVIPSNKTGTPNHVVWVRDSVPK